MIQTGGGQGTGLRDALIDWDKPDDEGGNTAHIAEQGLTPQEVESALLNENTTFDVSDSSGRPIAFGGTGTGRFIAIMFNVLNLGDPLVIRPITAYDVPRRRGGAMKPTMKPKRTAEQRAEEEAIRRQHEANPVRRRPAGAINRQSFTAILRLVSRFKAVRESQGLTLADVAERMGIDAPALSRLERGKMLNPTLATLHKWAEALGQKLDVDLAPA